MLPFLFSFGPGICPRTQLPLPDLPWLDNCPTDALDAITGDLLSIARAVALGICVSRANATTSTWDLWCHFCSSLGIADPTLQHLHDPIPVLQLFAHRYRLGIISPSKTPVRGRTVGDAVRAVGQTLAGLGRPDPRLQPSGKLEFRLSRQLASYNKSDPPPARVKPIPVTILHHTCATARLSDHPASQLIADMITLGFFFLLRPGEYAFTSNPESSPFRLCDIHLMVHNRRLNHLQCSDADLNSATFVGLEFTHQKNGVSGEIIGLGRSGDPSFCPVQATINRIRHLRQARAPTDTPLYRYQLNGQWCSMPTSTLTSALRHTIDILGPQFGITSSDISVRSLRSSGAMALLCTNVDTDRIRLLGRWRSDEMLRYLHVQAFPVVASLAPAMLLHGHFTLIPNTPLPHLGGTRGL